MIEEITAGIISFWIGWYISAKYHPIERLVKRFKK